MKTANVSIPAFDPEDEWFDWQYACHCGIIKNMIRKIVQKQDLDNFSEIRQNLRYWLSQPPEERLAAVDALRRESYGDSQRLQRVARVVQQA